MIKFQTQISSQPRSLSCLQHYLLVSVLVFDRRSLFCLQLSPRPSRLPRLWRSLSPYRAASSTSHVHRLTSPLRLPDSDEAEASKSSIELDKPSAALWVSRLCHVFGLLGRLQCGRGTNRDSLVGTVARRDVSTTTLEPVPFGRGQPRENRFRMLVKHMLVSTYRNSNHDLLPF